MKNKLLFTGILVAGLLVVSVGTNKLYGQTAKPKMELKDTVKYRCPHHPEVVSDKPGKCPKCGMELVTMKDNGNISKKSGMKEDNMMGDSTKMKKHGKMSGSKEMKDDKMKMMNDSSMMK